jgi:hypothetical protein
MGRFSLFFGRISEWLETLMRIILICNSYTKPWPTVPNLSSSNPLARLHEVDNEKAARIAAAFGLANAFCDQFF